ncbi:MAG TPA: hypothetical protein VEG33_02455 [Streptosporangiaceae bacterium]|nr:hypothetical protein [Streptosporangiaceae bacterium]
MDNFYRPAGDDPGDHQPTEQFWPGPGVPPGSQGPGDEYRCQQPPGRPAHPARDRRTARRWTAGIALAALVAGGGVIAGISLAGTTLSAAPAASTGTSGSGAAGATGTSAAAPGGGAAPASQAALLDATLNAADSPGAAVTTSAAGATSAGGPPATGTGAAATAPAVRRCAQLARAARAARLAGHPRLSRTARAATARCRFIRRRIVRFFLLRGIDGQFSFRTKAGTVRTIAYVRGVIQSVSNGTSIVVQAADGSTWTWQLVSTTVVRDTTGKISASTLAVGEPVWVGGPVASGVKDARLIFARPPSG